MPFNSNISELFVAATPGIHELLYGLLTILTQHRIWPTKLPHDDQFGLYFSCHPVS